MNIEGKTIDLFPASEPGAPLVVLNADAGEGDAVLVALREYTDKPLSLAVIDGLKWEDDLTPWPNPPIFRGSEPCAGRADDYLDLLTGRMLPQTAPPGQKKIRVRTVFPEQKKVRLRTALPKTGTQTEPVGSNRRRARLWQRLLPMTTWAVRTAHTEHRRISTS